MATFKESHIRSFNSMIRMVEDKLQEMEGAICGAGELKDKENVQLLTPDDLTGEEKDLVGEQIALIRQSLERFTIDYGLRKQERSLKKIITVKGAFLWEELSGATFDGLQGYGKIAASERNRYEQHIEPMTRLAENIMSLKKTTPNENKTI